MLKIGDRVRIKKFNNINEAISLSLGADDPLYFSAGMLVYCGKQFKVIGVGIKNRNRYYLDTDPKYTWHEKWLEPVSELKRPKIKDLL
jgi:hypothetical protein